MAGETTDEAIAATRRLTEAGLLVTLDHLGEDTTNESLAEGVVTVPWRCSTGSRTPV